jgi:hypothetical protein
MKKVVASLVVLALTFMLIAAVLIATGHASTTRPRPNTLGVAQFYDNPYAYLLALPVDGQVLEGKYTNIRFAPYAAPDLFVQSILFCGDVTPMFDGKTGVLAVTYRAQASRLYQGVACHEILSVFQVKAKEDN